MIVAAVRFLSGARTPVIRICPAASMVRSRVPTPPSSHSKPLGSETMTPKPDRATPGARFVESSFESNY
ncbi:hypothetical protein [Leifsonia xyli]|uniref:hypothetical protein n=1 Tax=Leifsonia xyli TaxID=1575 RepID=UPI0012DF9619|nr:hypothetical protein [Leifsonia xyli]